MNQIIAMYISSTARNLAFHVHSTPLSPLLFQHEVIGDMNSNSDVYAGFVLPWFLTTNCPTNTSQARDSSVGEVIRLFHAVTISCHSFQSTFQMSRNKSSPNSKPLVEFLRTSQSSRWPERVLWCKTLSCTILVKCFHAILMYMWSDPFSQQSS